MSPTQPKLDAKAIDAMPDDREALDGDEPNVSPEEQEQYDTVVGKAMELLYADDRLPVLVDKLKANPENVSGEIGHSAAMTMTTIATTVEKQGQKIPDDILYNAGMEVVSQITDIAIACGLVDQAQEREVAEAALYEALRVWGKSMGDNGKITDDLTKEAVDTLQMAGIKQDGGKSVAAGQPPAPAAPAPAGPPQPGLVNQAMGAPQ